MCLNGSDMCDVGGHFVHAVVEGSAQTRDAHNVFRACTVAPFLGSSLNEGLGCRSLADIGKADAFRPVKFMAAARRKMHLDLIEIQGQMRHGLYRIAVEVRSLSIAHRAEAL